MLGVICEREDPRDVVVMKDGSSFSTIGHLPAGSVVGTSSVRRKAQILRRYPELVCLDIRGNLNTRLRKLDADDSPYACLILAAAGMHRINLTHRITQYLDASHGMLYAPGQGALGLEIRQGDARMLQLLSPLAHRPTTLACMAEKSLLKTLEGGCSAPIGVETLWNDGMLTLHSNVTSIDGKQMVESSVQGAANTPDESENLGRELAKRLIDLGANRILEDIRTAARNAVS
jgi:hydroxymethylbilane synthase